MAVWVEDLGDYKAILEALRDGSPFTIGMTLEEFTKGLRKRFMRIYGEVLPFNHKEMVTALENKGIIKVMEREG